MSRDLKIVSAAMLLWGFGEGMFLIFQPLYIQQLGADPILIGTILGINGLVMTVSQIPAGYLADRIGRRPMVWFSFGAGVVATWLMALAPTLPYFVAGLLMYGLTSSVMAPLNTYVQTARGKWSVGRAISFVSAIYNAGGILGPVMGGLIGEGCSLRTVYFASAIFFTLSTVVILFAKEQPLADVSRVEGEKHLLQNRSFVGILVVIFLIMFAVTLPQPLAANFLQNQRSLSLSQIGRLGSIGALGSVLLMLVFGHLPVGIAMMIGQAGVLAFATLLWRFSGIYWYGVAYFFLGGYKLCRAMTVSLVRPVVREWEIGLAFGVVESLNALAMMIAPVVAGFLYDWQPIVIFPVGVAVLGLTLGLSLVFIKKNGFHGVGTLVRGDLEGKENDES